MLKKIVWICIIILVATTIYTVGLPSLKVNDYPIQDKKIVAAVLEYANTQMPQKCLSVPRQAEKWQVEEVEITKLNELPGPHSKRRIHTKISGAYTLPAVDGRDAKIRSFKLKCKFLISNKYPEGISVQYEG
jgi:hypothetical protein